jgi:hypothetical protein
MNYFCPSCGWKGIVLERTPHGTDRIRAILRDGKPHDRTELIRATRWRGAMMETTLKEMEAAKKITRYKIPTAGKAIEFVKAVQPAKTA